MVVLYSCVCTLLETIPALWTRIPLMNWNKSATVSAFILSISACVEMNAPVLPTPSLHIMKRDILGSVHVLIYHQELCAKVEIGHLPVKNSLAHDSNGLVSRAHLHLLHQVSHLQYPSGRLGDTILWPLHVLELGNSDTSRTTGINRHPRLAVSDFKFPDDIISTNLLLGVCDRDFSICFTGTTTQRPILMAHFL